MCERAFDDECIKTDDYAGKVIFVFFHETVEFHENVVAMLPQPRVREL